jgi:hypothetical protein
MGSFYTILAHIMEPFHPTQLAQQMVEQNVEFWSETQTQAITLRDYEREPAFELLKHFFSDFASWRVQQGENCI